VKEAMKAIIIGVIVLMALLFAGGFATITFWHIGRHISWMIRMTGFGWRIMFLIPMFFLALLALGVYYFLTGPLRAGGIHIREREDALEILKKRYARGELTTEQYAKMKEELQ
jgi:putative membrane protein